MPTESKPDPDTRPPPLAAQADLLGPAQLQKRQQDRRPQPGQPDTPPGIGSGNAEPVPSEDENMPGFIGGRNFPHR